jgi:hypothetical protein
MSEEITLNWAGDRKTRQRKKWGSIGAKVVKDKRRNFNFM